MEPLTVCIVMPQSLSVRRLYHNKHVTNKLSVGQQGRASLTQGCWIEQST